ncbi:hypothetical protein WSM22_16800 [Cytophagales bacterium WSM2-2]|nr:hypothetical protein WSM22_16800 [Cytophagales bacterium WSM2-2]
MKKIILLFFVCFSADLLAQKSFFGADGGVNVANQRVRSSYGNITTTSFYENSVQPTFGVFYHRSFSELFAIRVNAQYMGLGYKNPNADNLDIGYLTFPVTLHYVANKHLSLNAGAYLSFTVGGTKVNNEIITKTYHKNDFGLSFGAEHDLFKNLALSVNYFIGTKNIWLDDQGGNLKFTNRALQFGLIYKFKKTS